MGAVNPPILHSLILCDYVIKDVATGKLSLIGIFNGLYAHRFPCTHPMLYIYVALTDGRGNVPCRLRMVPLGGGPEVFALQGHVTFGDPTAVGEIIFPIPQLQIPAPGVYAIEFLANGELLGSRKLQVAPVAAA
ncbi:MAG: hypothetical protein KIS92_11200 [Planctomycetota bacterium]|nr:hypothetical protein [Planctomycetota bacterium]